MSKLSKWMGLVPAALFSVPALAAPEFMNFPVKGYSAFKPGIMSSVLDHEVPHPLDDPFKSTGPYGNSGGILSFTGELFVATSKSPRRNQGCYPKTANSRQSSTWSSLLSSIYTGTSSRSENCSTKVALNYDNHPGYDYIIPEGKSVNPAASGYIISTKCLRTFGNSKTCEDFGAVAVDHMNGFVTQYLHMRSPNYGTAARGVNQKVDTKYLLGTVYREGVTAVHLHLEVLKRKEKPVNKNNYYDRANYMIVDPYGYNSSSYYADLLQSKSSCLWVGGCRY